MAAVAILSLVPGALAAGASGAQAQGKLDARYSVLLNGVVVAKGAWYVDIGEEQYTAGASGGTTGLLRVISTGQGSSAARGYVQRGALVPASYTSTVTADKKSEDIRIVLSGGNVREVTADPPAPPNPDRVPITEVHRRNVLDPMTAALVRMPGAGDPLGPEACNRKISIFDARLRYDLQLVYKRMDRVKAERGYDGPVVVCQTLFTPVAGYVPDRYSIKYLSEQRDMETWFAPIAGTRVLVPFRVVIPTPLGVGVLEATQFVATAAPPRPTPTSAKIQ